MSGSTLSDNIDRADSGPVVGAGAEQFGLDAHFMQRAIGLARPCQPHPNPRVGAVIVDRNGNVVAEGAHQRAGEAHAEVVALRGAGERARGATLYVTLEPCSHHGRTPPCTRAVIDGGISRVVVGAVDPDVRVSGSGIAELRRAGIQVTAGVLVEEVEAADPGYFHHRRTGRPLVTLKLATTLDGQLAAADGTSQWITGEAARADAHRLRADADLVVVGAGTVLEDDPRLNVRLPEYDGRQPRPVIVAGSRPLPASAALYARDPIVYVPEPIATQAEQVVAGAAGRVDLGVMLEDLGSRGYVSALVEGGARLAAAMVRGGHVDQMVLYLAAKLGVGTGLAVFDGVFGTISEAVAVEIQEVDRLGDDIRVLAKVSG